MSLNESIVEDAALAMPMAALTRPLPRGEENREAIRRLNPAIPSRTLSTLRDTLLPKLLSGDLSVVETLTKSL